METDRRQYPRLVVHSPMLVSLAIAALLCSLLVLLGFYLTNFRKVEVQQEQGRAESSAGSLQPHRFVIHQTTEFASTSELPLGQPGFVLQVGAMKYEEHADALAASLNSRHSPALAFKRFSDRFYKVEVGPCGDVDSSNKVKGELQKQNFTAILKPWWP